MTKKGALWLLASVLGLMVCGQAVYATPTPHYLIVNHADRECAESILGDDCSWCDPPPGWEVVGPAYANSCPEGYRRVGRLDMVCRRYETPFCCSGGAHRGDCENMVVHDADRSCAFAAERQDCALPDGWRARPSDVDPWRWSCPIGYGWVEDVDCISQELSPVMPPRAIAALAVACLLALVAAVTAVGLVLVFVVARRRAR